MGDRPTEWIAIAAVWETLERFSEGKEEASCMINRKYGQCHMEGPHQDSSNEDVPGQGHN
jgi:hypothetical protein